MDKQRKVEVLHLFRWFTHTHTLLHTEAVTHRRFYTQTLLHTDPSTTLYYKACTKHVPVLPCITKLAQDTSQIAL